MTAPDPRLGEIAARLSAAPGVHGMYSFHGSDVAYLLAALAARDAKLAAVERVLTRLNSEAINSDDGARYAAEINDGAGRRVYEAERFAFHLARRLVHVAIRDAVADTTGGEDK